MNLKPTQYYGDAIPEADAFYFSVRGTTDNHLESVAGFLTRATFNEVAAALGLPPLPDAQAIAHERRVVGHLSGWQEQMHMCVCGAPWPCPQAPHGSTP